MTDLHRDAKGVDLINAIEDLRKNVHTQSLDLSFNELTDMYESNELDINPDYQRLFQWSEGARSRFIETLLLEMPVPPIYVVEEEEGRYLLIDGLQRISSYLHFRGVLEANHLDPPVQKGDKLVLIDCDIVKQLNGKTFDDLSTALQIRLKRSFVRVEVVRKGSDPRFKYYMFKRLNTGGMRLSEQQVRNCTIRLLDATFNDFIIRLSKKANFGTCIETLNQERRLSAHDQELVLRFFALKNWRDKFRHDVGDFLTEYMEAVADPTIDCEFNQDREEAIFDKTFYILARTLEGGAFAFANPARTKVTRGFSIYHYEAFTLGLQPLLDKLDAGNPQQMKQMKETLENIKFDADFIRITTGGGKNSPGPLKERIDFVTKKVGAIL